VLAARELRCAAFVRHPENRMEIKMPDFLRAMKSRAAVALAAAFLVALPSLSHAQSSGSVRLKVSKAGFIVGVGGGSGTLTYKGKTYPLRVGGISAGTIGIASADLTGTAKNLRSPQDIAGTYSAIGASVAVAGGAKAVALKNSNGVVLELKGTQVGFEASFNLSGLTISLE
jgi:hypothetical protein